VLVEPPAAATIPNVRSETTIRFFGPWFYRLGRYGPARHSDPAPLSPRQLRALVAAAGRGITWIWPAVFRELEHWKCCASLIPNAQLRQDALKSIELKRENAHGAALFCILPKRRESQLLTLLVAYQTLWDYLDNVGERGAFTDSNNGYQLHRALTEALDPDAPISDYYRYHPWSDDGGYLQALVSTCQRCCLALPSYAQIRPFVLAGVQGCAIQAINHLPDRRQRESELKAWAERQRPAHQQLRWFEVTAAASAFLPHALLALATEPLSDTAYVRQTQEAYFPWMALAIAMLDSYVDAAQDTVNGSHSYIAHYPDQHTMCERLHEILTLTVRETARLPNGPRHVLIAASMIAMYLSARVDGEPEVLAIKERITSGGGSVTRLLVPAAGLWRTLERRHASSALLQLSARATAAHLPQAPVPAPLQTFLFWHSPFQYLQRCQDRYGPTFALRSTSQPPLIFLTDPHDIRSLMAAPANTLRPGEGGAAISPIVGKRSFMLSDDAEHITGRKAVLAAFHTHAVNQHIHMVAGATQRATADWPTDRKVALHPRLRSLTLEVILRTLAGHLADPLDKQILTLRDRVLEMLTVTASPVLIEPHLRHGPGRRIWQSFLRTRAQVDDLLGELIDERSEPYSAGDLLGRLIALPNPDGSPASHGQVRDNAMSLILAGHETTAAQLAWAFQLLAHHPHVREHLHREIDDGQSEDYLTATIQEVLRHRCVFLFAIPRAVAKPITIGGHTHYPPAHLLACIYLLHHDPKTYLDPHVFRPERFLQAPPDPRTWMPWGGGGKRCPGLHLAMLEMKTVLRTVLSTKTVHPASRCIERPGWRSVIVTPHAGSRVILRPRRRY
jgi:tetraprenyl-beta-curcumene synthase